MPVAVGRQVALQLPPLTVVEQLALHSPMRVILNGGCVVQLRTASEQQQTTTLSVPEASNYVGASHQ
jgi:hypothetical protein